MQDHTHPIRLVTRDGEVLDDVEVPCPVRRRVVVPRPVESSSRFQQVTMTAYVFSPVLSECTKISTWVEET